MSPEPGTVAGGAVPFAGQRLSGLTARELVRTITAMAAPVVLGQISQTLMGLVDTLMVGRLGAAPLAAVAVATLLFSGLAMSIKAVDVAAQTFTARRVGQRRDSEVGAIFATAWGVCLLLGSLAMFVGLMWPEALIGLATGEPVVQTLGGQYLVYRYAGILPLLFFFRPKLFLTVSAGRVWAWGSALA